MTFYNLIKKIPKLKDKKALNYFFHNNKITHLAKRALIQLKPNHSKILHLWSMAEGFSIEGRMKEAETIYKKLAKLKPINPLNYSYLALSTLRLGDVVMAYTIFEEGIKKYPEYELLRLYYFQICSIYYEYVRYSTFMKQLIDLGVNVDLSLNYFYEKAMKNEDPSSLLRFIFCSNTIQSDCTPNDFTALKELFLEMLTKHSLSLFDAKCILYYAGCLDIDHDFLLAISKRLKKIFDHDHVDSNNIIYTLKILQSLALPYTFCDKKNSDDTINAFIKNCKQLTLDSIILTQPMDDLLNSCSPWQCVFLLADSSVLYQYAISAFEQFVFARWPQLNYISPHLIENAKTLPKQNKKIKIGFTVLDSMPMMSGLLRQLDKTRFDTVFLRPGKAGSSEIAQEWMSSANEIVEYSDTNTFLAIETIAAQKLDIIISGPSVASIFYPMMARLASLQMVLLEPNWTNGLTNADYYISWRPAEPALPQEYYKTAVSYLEHPPYWITKPASGVKRFLSKQTRAATRKKLLHHNSERTIYLCSNTPPKIHARMDDMFSDLLNADPNAIIVLLRGDSPIVNTLKARFKKKLKHNFHRMVFLPTLSQQDAHALLLSVDCCLDSFPLCGMSSSFDAIMLGVPVVTFPFDIPFGKWTASIYDYIGVDGLIAHNQDDYIQIALRVAKDVAWRKHKMKEIKEKASLFVESTPAFEELQHFIIHAWKRKISDLSPVNWINGVWQDS